MNALLVVLIPGELVVVSLLCTFLSLRVVRVLCAWDSDLNAPHGGMIREAVPSYRRGGDCDNVPILRCVDRNVCARLLFVFRIFSFVLFFVFPFFLLSSRGDA